MMRKLIFFLVAVLASQSSFADSKDSIGWYLGGGIWEATSDQVLVPLSGGAAIVRQVDSDGTDFMLGIGAGVNIGKNLHARLEYQAFRTDDELLSAGPGQEARFDLVSLELHWRFGSSR